MCYYILMCTVNLQKDTMKDPRITDRLQQLGIRVISVCIHVCVCVGGGWYQQLKTPFSQMVHLYMYM